MVRIEDYCDIADGGLVIRGRLQQYIRQNIITCDPVMLRQLDMLDRLSASNVPLTILGEAGCGKDSIAQYAHDVSARKNKPFLKINCAYLTEDLVTAELLSRGCSVGRRAAASTSKMSTFCPAGPSTA